MRRSELSTLSWEYRDLDNLLPGEHYDSLETVAADFIEDYGITSYPIRPSKLFAQMGIPVLTYAQASNSIPLSILLRASEDAFHCWNDSMGLRGLVVVYNDHADARRIKTSLMHELAHILCEHPSNEEPYEREAKYLASYLQAPTPLLVHMDLSDPTLIAKIFTTSKATAKARASCAIRRKKHGADWYEREIRILDCCKEWLEAEEFKLMLNGFQARHIE